MREAMCTQPSTASERRHHAALRASRPPPAFPGGRRKRCALSDRFRQSALVGGTPAGPEVPLFWAAHGADQLLHQLTYAAMIFLMLMFGRGGMSSDG